MVLERLKEINDQKAQNALIKQRHSELLLDNTKTQEIIVKSFARLVDFLDNRTGRTEVVNQLREIGTPDVEKVVTALDSLHETLKTHENTDLSEITQVMQALLQEAKQIPKSHNKIDIPKPIDHSEQFKSLEETVRAVEEAVKSQKLVAEAPVVNVPETQVNVEAPDLKPIETSITKSSGEVVKAVKGIKIPELNTDPVEKLLKKANTLLKEIADKPVGGGGGGGGRATPYEDSDGIPAFVPVNPDRSLPTASKPQAVRIDDQTTADTTYIGKASVGSLTSGAVWQIAKLDTSSGLVKTWADGDASFNNVWDNRASLTYS